MGDIPGRSIFNRKETRSSLLPYKHIVLVRTLLLLRDVDEKREQNGGSQALTFCTSRLKEEEETGVSRCLGSCVSVDGLVWWRVSSV